jgi:hypothetical protein
VELSATPIAFSGNARGVSIKNLTIEKYASSSQYGAIQARIGYAAPPNPGDNSQYWLIEGCTIQHNHAGGIVIGDYMTVRNTRVNSNGQIGIRGMGSNTLIERSEIAYNNYAGYQWGWEAGATKILYSTNTVFRNNHVHHNKGAGIWYDWDNKGGIIEGNIVEHNTNPGIFYECNYDGIIRNNVARYNSNGASPWLWGSQIQVACSQNVDVSHNTVVVGANGGNGIGLIQQNRGSASLGLLIVQNNAIHDNHVYYLGAPGQSGAVADYDPGGGTIFTRNNRFTNNHYHAANSGNRWQWNGALTFTQWQAAGQDTTGTFDTNLALPADPIVGPSTTATTTDTTAPTISTPQASVSGTTATVTFTTNEATSTQVTYGTFSSYGQTTASDAMGTTHSTQLSGLVPGSTYHFQVLARDGAGNLATAPDQTFTVPQLRTVNANWTFSEGSGSLARDSAGANHAQIAGATWVDGARGTALQFDGSDFLSVADSADLRMQEFSIALFFRASTDQGIRALISKPSGGTDNSYVIYLNNQVMEFHSSAYGGTLRFSPVAKDRWYHVVVTKSGTTTKLYVDGVQVASSTSAPAQVTYTDLPLFIGAEDDNGDRLPELFFQGTIDEVQLFARELTANEVTALATRDIPRDTTAPQLSGVMASDIGNSSARIIATVDEEATCSVRIAGEQAGTAMTATGFQHAVLKSGLLADTTYSFTVSCTDTSGNTNNATASLRTLTNRAPDTDGDGVVDSIDRCPSTPIGTAVNKRGCPLQRSKLYTMSASSSLDETDLQSVPALQIEKAGVGTISFEEPVNLIKENTAIDLDTIIRIEPARITVDTNGTPGLNVSATLTIYGLDNVTDPVILRDGQVCDDCAISSFSGGALVFRVPHFTEYTVVQNSCGDLLCASTENCTTCPTDCSCAQPDTSTIQPGDSTSSDSGTAGDTTTARSAGSSGSGSRGGGSGSTIGSGVTAGDQLNDPGASIDSQNPGYGETSARDDTNEFGQQTSPVAPVTSTAGVPSLGAEKFAIAVGSEQKTSSMLLWLVLAVVAIEGVLFMWHRRRRNAVAAPSVAQTAPPTKQTTPQTPVQRTSQTPAQAYISAMREHGASDLMIKTKMMQAGWSTEMIQEEFSSRNTRP